MDPPPRGGTRVPRVRHAARARVRLPPLADGIRRGGLDGNGAPLRAPYRDVLLDGGRGPGAGGTPVRDRPAPGVGGDD